MKRMLLFMGILTTLQAVAQHQSVEIQKLSPGLVSGKSVMDKRNTYLFLVVAHNPDSLKNWLMDSVQGVSIVTEYRGTGLLILQSSLHTVESVIIPSNRVKFVDVVRKPVEETQLDGLDLSTNKINLVHAHFPALNGNATVISIKENRPDTTDIDLKGRFISMAGASQIVTSHATIMATIAAGGGNSYITGKGVAWGANLTSSSFANLIPDADSYYKQHNISVQNHSYGTGIENYYGADAAAYDASTISNRYLLHVFSSGNSGDKSSQFGRYTGIAGYANVTGSFKMAKNIITVGAIDSFAHVAALSSRGPAYDGRVKPELVAFGLDGSSGAAALVSGTALLLQQAFKEGSGGQLPSSALIKAILLNSANDIGPRGPDFQSGYGSLNAYHSVKTVLDKRFFSGSIIHGQQQAFSISVPAGTERLKITLCWNDPPAAANAPKALVNNVDLELIEQSSGQRWKPWILSSFTDLDSLSKTATRGRDTINNVEQITLEYPAAGVYTLQLEAPLIQSGSQEYHIAYQVDRRKEVDWEFPSASDHIAPNTNTTLRWRSSLSIPSGELTYSLDEGQSWTTVSSAINLNDGYFRWRSPAKAGRVLFKITADAKSFVSDTVLISSSPQVRVGYNCADSFSLYWNKVPDAWSYTVHVLDDKYLRPLTVVTDSTITLKKALASFTHYSVSANFSAMAGVKSPAFNYTTQGVDCYLRNFLVDADAGVATIRFELGTTYEIDSITLEKAGPGGFTSIQKITQFGRLLFNYVDSRLSKGENSYRLRITLQNGKFIYSAVETIYHLADASYIIYPNPAPAIFKVILTDSENAELILFTSTGKRVFTRILSSPVQQVYVPGLQKGLYFVIIRKRGERAYSSSLVIQ